MVARMIVWLNHYAGTQAMKPWPFYDEKAEFLTQNAQNLVWMTLASLRFFGFDRSKIELRKGHINTSAGAPSFLPFFPSHEASI